MFLNVIFFQSIPPLNGLYNILFNFCINVHFKKLLLYVQKYLTINITSRIINFSFSLILFYFQEFFQKHGFTSLLRISLRQCTRFGIASGQKIRNFLKDGNLHHQKTCTLNDISIKLQKQDFALIVSDNHFKKI